MFILFLLKTLLKDKPLKQPLEFRLQNSLCFSQNCFSVAEESHMHEAREPHMPFPSLALHFQPRSRPFVWLLARTWIRKNTGCFAVYLVCLVVLNPQALKEKADAALFLFSFTDRYVSSLIIQLTTDNFDLVGKLKCLSYWG